MFVYFIFPNKIAKISKLKSIGKRTDNNAFKIVLSFSYIFFDNFKFWVQVVVINNTCVNFRR